MTNLSNISQIFFFTSADLTCTSAVTIAKKKIGFRCSALCGSPQAKNSIYYHYYIYYYYSESQRPSNLQSVKH